MSARIWKSKRLTVLSLAMLMFAMTACSSGGGTKEEATGSPAPTKTGDKATETPVVEKASGPKAFKLWLGRTATVDNNSMVQTYWKEKDLGIEVKIEATQGDPMTALNLKLNTGGFEDAAMFERKDVVTAAMIRSNLVLPLEQYFDMPDKYPELAKIPKLYLDAMKDKDGHIWSLPGWFDQNPSDPWPGWASLGWFVRTDVLDKTGKTLEDLKTLTGLEDYLRLAAKQTDASGKKLIPLSFLSDANDENVVLSTFGVTAGITAGVIPVSKKGDDYEFIYDNPQYKTAYQWMNKMYRENLIDHEAITDKKERYKEKNKTGRIAMNVGGFFNMDASLWEVLDGPTEPAWFYEAIPFPKVDGVSAIGTNLVINPYPANDIFISKSSKNLDAILAFFNYTLTQKPEQQQVVNEGPAGVFWDWVDKPLGKWLFTDKKYQELHDSGDAAKVASTNPALYGASSYNNQWYPWWNYGVTEPKGRFKTIEFTEKVGKMGGARVVEPYDMVKAKAGGLWEKYLPELEAIRIEYKAKLLMAKDDTQFESVWKDFQAALTKRAHWSELKVEWHEELAAGAKK